MKVTAILASHNRSAMTLACLESFFAQETELGTELRAVLSDAGSTDGTAEAVGRRFPQVQVIRGTGELFWAGGMAVAEDAALAGSPDYLLWLNDDVELKPGSLASLLDAHESLAGDEREGIIVGAVCDPNTRAVTYSGVWRVDRHPLHYEIVQPAGRPVEADTFHGNVVLVPRRVCVALGAIDREFTHAAADFDYGLRAREAGYAVVVAGEIVGTCPRSSADGTWKDRSLTVRERWRLAFARKGLPPRSTARYLRRHGGRVWVFWWVTPYVKFAVLSLRDLRPKAKNIVTDSRGAP